jgi:hydrogenase maturation protein HypF
MRQFSMCDDCRSEHNSPDDRHFHAESLACSKCGPQVWSFDARTGTRLRGAGAIEAAARELAAGRIVALRGVGGYQLLVDASDTTEVDRLRERKGRRAKPLAVMVATVDDAARLAHIDPVERQVLASPANPIVVLQARSPNGIAPSVSCGMHTLGIMLSTTALHVLLLKAVARPLVATSGNHEGLPLVYDVSQAEVDLSGVADLWLHHDRPIHAPIDDSVMRVIAGRPVTLRLARGMAPRALDIPGFPSAIALGGHFKAAIALSNGHQSVLAPHVGDLDSLDTRQQYVQHVEAVSKLYATCAELVVHDVHPDYFTTHWAESLDIPKTAVWHHHAHVVSGMIEHGWLDREVLGVAFDGTGFGPDDTIWGGEFLLANAREYRRVGHLLPFALPGGESAVREPWRVAVSVVASAVGRAVASRLKFACIPASRVAGALAIMNSRKWSPVSTSAGRLFDAVAALTLGITHVDFEGQAAMYLEAACDAGAAGVYDFEIVDAQPLIVDWRPMVRQLLADVRRGEPPPAIATRFHRGLARAVVEVCRRFTNRPVVLTGGVFQNRFLVEHIAEHFDSRQSLGLPGVIPPGDGGLAAGQLAVAVARIQLNGDSTCAWRSPE